MHTDHQLLFCFDLFDFDEMLDLEDHAAYARIVDLIDAATDLTETERLERSLLIVLLADRRFDLRDAENIPFTYDGGIDSFIQNEVLTYAPDAYVDEKKTQVGYEISFTKYFYKPIELREMKDIIESLNALEKEADGMMAEIMDTPILSIQLVTRQEMLMDIKS